MEDDAPDDAHTGLVAISDEAAAYQWTEADEHLVTGGDSLPQKPVPSAFLMICAILQEEDTMKANHFEWAAKCKAMGPVRFPVLRVRQGRVVDTRVTVMVSSEVDYPRPGFISRHTPRVGHARLRRTPSSSSSSSHRPTRGPPGAWSPFVHRPRHHHHLPPVPRDPAL